jgi:hypothetical protein
MQRFYLTILIASAIAFPLLKVNAQGEMRPARGNPEKATAGTSQGKSGETGLEKAQVITKEEGMKKYPPPRGGYPTAELTEGANRGGIVRSRLTSPYPPHHKFDASQVPQGGLILDPYAKRVFIKP